MNFEEMKDWCNDAQRSLGRELDRLQEQQHLETEVRAKPMEIHNHFEPGSSSQVFNDQVS